MLSRQFVTSRAVLCKLMNISHAVLSKPVL